MIKRILIRILIALLIVFAAYLIISNITYFKGLKVFSDRMVIIDADNGNEIDGVYAVVRALIEPDLEITGLLSTQWNFAENAPDTSVRISQEINKKILKLLNKTNIPHPVGAGEMISCTEKPIPQLSDAAKFIIDRAHELPSGEKMIFITLGAVTNLASAILIDTSIIPKLDCYIAGLKYDHIKRIWNKNEFNTRNDLDAMDVILNARNLDLTVMTATVSNDLIFQREEIVERLSNKGDIWNYILEHQDKNLPEDKEWIMRDVAVIEAFLRPGFAAVREVYTPPENTRRKIRVYTKIKTEAMIKDYWRAVEEYSDY